MSWESDPHELDPELALARVVTKDFESVRVLDRLIMYERRIENSLYKTIRELKKIQTEKMKNEPNFKADRRPPGIGPFYLPDRKNNPDTPQPIHKNIQNEPNSNGHVNVSPAITNDYESELLCGAPSLTTNTAQSVIPTERSERRERRDLSKSHPPLANSANNQ